MITRLIKDEIDQDKFSLGNFYARRVRRLFPALFVTVVATFILAVLMFSPAHLRRFAGELIYSLASISNFYFWSESGYFDADAHFKPLLHTWSLSVEEQFYLFWPLLLVFLLSRLRDVSAILVILVLGCFSFALNLIFQGGNDVIRGVSLMLARLFEDGGSTIYFLTPFRIFEFAIGAIMVWLADYRPKNNWPLELLLLIGFGLAVVPVFVYNDTLLFPSYYALAPCIGAALMIYAGEARYLGWLLKNPLSVRIGLISYSLYLVHWPIYVFYRYYVYGEITTAEKYGVLLASFVMALLMYHFVEQRYRRPLPNTPVTSKAAFGLGCALLAILLILPAATAWANNGWVSRAKAYIVNLNEIKCHSDKVCEHQKGTKGTVLLVGDSHMAHHTKTLLEKFPGYTVHVFNVAACYFGSGYKSTDHNLSRGKLCERANRSLRSYISEHGKNITYVVHGQRWHGYSSSLYTLAGDKPLIGNPEQRYRVMLQDVAELYAPISSKILVLGAAPNIAEGCTERADFFPMMCRARGRNILQSVNVSKRVSENLFSPQIKFIHPVNALCNGKRCLEAIGNRKLYRDSHHLTRDGSNLVLRKFNPEA